MDDSRNGFSKKICLSKSQFNKKIRQQLNSLDHLRKHNNTTDVTLTQTQFNFEDTLSNDTLIQENCVTPLGIFSENSFENSNLACQTLSLDESSSSTILNSRINSNDHIVNCEKTPTATVLSLTDQLRGWAVRNKITFTALSELLTIQRQIPEFESIPKDPRSFLQTPRQTVLRDVHPGKYYHFGLDKGINNILKNISYSDIPDTINVGINIDGLPLSKSSSSQVYPILCLINNVDVLFSNIFCVGIYHGYEKPSDFNLFLEEFVDEAIILTLNGIVIAGNHYNFKINMFLFDAVAKASVLFIKGHSGYSSCSKCTQEGEYLNSVCFPEIEFIKRTDQDFINQTDVDHHTGHTILEKIPNIGLVTEVPLDYMHLICLGVVKKLLVSTWCFGPPPHKLPARIVKDISDSLINMVQYIPCEFVRKPRALKEAKRFKATELRQFILYTGVVALKNNLEKKKYEHFLTLHFSISILLSDQHMQTMVDYAEELLKHFVICTKLIYGPQFMSHNFHNLLHLSDDARKYGNLNSFSNFSSENYLQKIKKMLRKHNDILPQIVRRLSEINSSQVLPICKIKLDIKLNKEHNKGILIDDTCDPQYKEAVFSNFKLSKNVQDSCCKLKCSTIIEISNFAFSKKLNQPVVIGKKYNKTSDFYTKPSPSSLIGIQLVDNLNEHFSYWPITLIHQKLIRLPYNNNSSFVVFPLLHTYER